MKRYTYIKPACQLIPFHSESVMVIEGSTGASTPFAKETDFEEADWNDDIEITFGHTVKTHDVWDDFSDYKNNKIKRR